MAGCNISPGFFTYSDEVHIARMAGCNSFLADSLDETQLSVTHAAALTRELLGMPLGRGGGGSFGDAFSSVGSESDSDDTARARVASQQMAYQSADTGVGDVPPAWATDKEGYFAVVKKYNRLVWCVGRGAWRNLVDEDRLRSLIWWFLVKKRVKGWFGWGRG